VETEFQVTAGEIRELFVQAALNTLTPETPVDFIAERLRALQSKLNGNVDALNRATIRSMLLDLLKEKRVSGATDLVDAALRTKERAAGLQGQAVAFSDPEPSPEPVDGAALLERLREFAGRFLGLPPGADVLFSAFAVYSYVTDVFAAATYIVLHSPAPQCGKTRALEVLSLLVRRPWLTIVPSTAVLFRVLEQSRPTLLLDEAEIVSGRGDAAADVCALLQSGYRRGAFVPRCVGEANEVRNFQVFGPKVFALIGELPPALFDRCIRVEMQRRTRDDKLPRFRPARLEAEALALRGAARRWAEDSRDALAQVEVPPLECLSERAEEVWEPLFAVGLVAGGRWFERLREAAKQLSGGRTTTSVGVDLLADIRAIFTARGVDRLASADLAMTLNELEGHRWADWYRGKGMTANGIARLLRDFGVQPGTVRMGEATAKGYRKEQLEAVWSQYISPATVTTSQHSQDGPYLANPNRNSVSSVTVENRRIVAESGHCDVVTVEKQGEEGDGQYDALERVAIKDEGVHATQPEGALVVTPVGGLCYRVTGGAESHMVELGPSVHRCDCPDHQYRRRMCKHIRAAERHVDIGLPPEPENEDDSDQDAFSGAEILEP
jgi:Protein of unknown function (DUF3631)/SWIM zinc finger